MCVAEVSVLYHLDQIIQGRLGFHIASDNDTQFVLRDAWDVLPFVSWWWVGRKRPGSKHLCGFSRRLDVAVVPTPGLAAMVKAGCLLQLGDP